MPNGTCQRSDGAQMAKQGTKARFQKSTVSPGHTWFQNFFVLWQYIVSCAVLHKLQRSRLHIQKSFHAEILLKPESWNNTSITCNYGSIRKKCLLYIFNILKGKTMQHGYLLFCCCEQFWGLSYYFPSSWWEVCWQRTSQAISRCHFHSSERIFPTNADTFSSNLLY